MMEPARLAAVFCRELPAQASCLQPSLELSAYLAEVLAAARRAWPDIQVDDAEFMRYLATRAAEMAGLRALRTQDLYICCACVKGVPRALAVLERRFFPELDQALQRARVQRSLRDDALQLLRLRLFMPDGQGRLRIADYSGRGALLSWLRVAAVRIALDLQRSQRSQRSQLHVQAEDSAELLEMLPLSPDPDFVFLKNTYRGPCRESLQTALRGLPDQERTLLYLKFVDGLNIDQIGAFYKVHRATAARWLVHARELLLQETKHLLAKQLQLSPGDAETLMRQVQSQLLSDLHLLLR